MLPTPFGLPSFLRFARFRVIGIPLAMMGLEVHRETAQNAKAWPFFRSILSRSRSCVYLQPSTQYAWSLDLSPQSITLRRATLGKNTGVGTFVSATTAETESAHVRRTLLAAGGFGGDTSLLRCTFAPVRGTPWPGLIDFCCFRHHLDAIVRHFTAMAENCGNRSRVGRPKLWVAISHQHCRTVSATIQSGL